jgi:hypothetical protein
LYGSKKQSLNHKAIYSEQRQHPARKIQLEDGISAVLMGSMARKVSCACFGD